MCAVLARTFLLRQLETSALDVWSFPSRSILNVAWVSCAAVVNLDVRRSQVASGGSSLLWKEIKTHYIPGSGRWILDPYGQTCQCMDYFIPLMFKGEREREGSLVRFVREIKPTGFMVCNEHKH